MTAVRGIRGATGVRANEPKAIEAAVRELLTRLVEENGVKKEDIAAAYFTATPDLHSDFPARAARKLGWTSVPLMCSQELDIHGAPERIVRVLLLVNTDRTQKEIRHLYLMGAEKLRPDLGK